MMNDEQRPSPAVHPSPFTLHPSRISIIVAMANNRVIGADNAIPWHLPGELKMFKTITMGHHIVMGRITWESIGRLLPGRTTVVVTRQAGYAIAGAIVAASQKLRGCTTGASNSKKCLESGQMMEVLGGNRRRFQGSPHRGGGAGEARATPGEL